MRCFTITLLIELNQALDGAVLVTKGLFTWTEEDPRTSQILDGEQLLLGLDAESLVCVVLK